MSNLTSRITLDLEVPKPPEKLKVVGEPLELSISMIGDDELKRVGRTYTENLIKKAHELREKKAKEVEPAGDSQETEAYD